MRVSITYPVVVDQPILMMSLVSNCSMLKIEGKFSARAETLSIGHRREKITSDHCVPPCFVALLPGQPHVFNPEFIIGAERVDIQSPAAGIAGVDC